jgi:phosphopantothenoylcysteine decarboxylase/phosphopantothenate--cysteine ligase
MRTVVLGVSAAIAAYKACEILRGLQKAGCEVRVIMTERAREFVGPLTFQSLSGHPVVTEMFGPGATGTIEHIRLAREADLFLAAPCTADVIGKFAGGIADDFLTTFFMATDAPVLVAPSMNVVMWSHSPVQRNVRSLRKMGIHVVEPAEGDLACGEWGSGRLAPVDEIVDRALGILGIAGKGDLAGRRVLVTAGPTAEDLDPVRTLTNRSTGRMGFAVAREALARGAEVVLVHGPTHLKPPSGAVAVPVRSALEMREAVLERLEGTSIVVAAAAVSDFRPASYSESKLSKEKGEAERTVQLVRNPDVLAEAAAAPGREGRILVGFAVESGELEPNARRKMEEKDLDLVVANPVASFEVESSRALILDRRGESQPVGPAPKETVARAILDRVAELLGG